MRLAPAQSHWHLTVLNNAGGIISDQLFCEGEQARDQCASFLAFLREAEGYSVTNLDDHTWLAAPNSLLGALLGMNRVVALVPCASRHRPI